MEPHHDAVPGWACQPVLAVLIRFGVLMVPIVSGVAVGAALTRAIPRPNGMAAVPWFLVVLGASTVTVTLVDRLARRLLPLATLLRLSLAFPDRIPSRFKLARQAGNIRVLERRIVETRERGLDDDPSKAAEEILTLVAALSAHDRKTRGHSERVRVFTDMLAEEFDLSPTDCDRLRWAALLHDVGKLDVPSEILNMRGKPDKAEWERLRRHPLEGERIAAPLAAWLGSWAAVIGQHHERWDGGGYPCALSGEDIGLGARIVSVADSFEVMTAARSYKRPMTPTAARRELQQCADGQFDPQVVRAFLNISLGRLWWAVGPASWVAQIPFMLHIGRTGGQALTLARAGTALAVNGLAGILALGVGAAVAAPGPQPSTGATVGVVAPADRSWSVSPHPGGSDSVQTGSSDGGDVEVVDESSDAGEDQTSQDDPGPGDDSDDVGGATDIMDGATDTLEDVTDDVTDSIDEVVDDVTGVVDDVTGVVDDVADDYDPVDDDLDDVTGSLGVT